MWLSRLQAIYMQAYYNLYYLQDEEQASNQASKLQQARSCNLSSSDQLQLVLAATSLAALLPSLPTYLSSNLTSKKLVLG